MKYKMSVVTVDEEGFEIPDDAWMAGVIPNYETNKWLIAFLVPVEEEGKGEESAAEETGKDD